MAERWFDGLPLFRLNPDGSFSIWADGLPLVGQSDVENLQLSVHDTIGVVDTPKAVIPQSLRAVFETIGVVDAFTVSVPLVRLTCAVFETVTLSEFWARDTRLNRSALQILTVTDFVQKRSVTTVRLSGAQAIGVTDTTSTRLITKKYQAVNDAIGVTDSVTTRMATALRQSVAETTSVTENVQTRLTTAVRLTVSETVILAELVATRLTTALRRAVSDVVTVTDASTQTVQYPWPPSTMVVNVADTIVVSEYRLRSGDVVPLTVVVGENIHTSDHRAITTAPAVWDGSGSPPAPAGVAADYWLVGV